MSVIARNLKCAEKCSPVYKAVYKIGDVQPEASSNSALALSRVKCPFVAVRIAVEGSLYHIIHTTVEAVTETMSSVAVWTAKGLGTASYPPEAIWEIIVNAFIHRDYSISDDVQVKIFDNRIEVLSPGRLPGYVKVDNILDSRYSRNPKIVRTSNWYKNPLTRISAKV